MTSASILVVDNDAASRALIAGGLREFGHDVSESTNAGSAWAAVRARRPDLMVCDCGLPDLAGVELLTDLRRNDELRGVRVMMTSARDKEKDVVAALESGADDFVGKPINLPELIARVDACLRRPASNFSSKVLSAGGIEIDDTGHRITADGESLAVAPREYELLLFLLSNQDRVFSRRQLLRNVWNREATVGPRTVDVHIRRLRSMMEPFGYDRYLQTVRGSGYRFSVTL